VLIEIKVAEFESLSVVFSSERVTNSIAAVNPDAFSIVVFFSSWTSMQRRNWQTSGSPSSIGERPKKAANLRQ
jgi:hypothetical protein